MEMETRNLLDVMEVETKYFENGADTNKTDIIVTEPINITERIEIEQKTVAESKDAKTKTYEEVVESATSYYQVGIDTETVYYVEGIESETNDFAGGIQSGTTDSVKVMHLGTTEYSGEEAEIKDCVEVDKQKRKAIVHIMGEAKPKTAANSEGLNTETTDFEKDLKMKKHSEIFPHCPFICGFCMKKFRKVETFYTHLKIHSVIVNKSFHICSDSDAVHTSKESEMSYKCDSCSCRFSTICTLHDHFLNNSVHSHAYLYDHEHRTAYPVKSLCSFFEFRNDGGIIKDNPVELDLEKVKASVKSNSAEVKIAKKNAECGENKKTTSQEYRRDNIKVAEDDYTEEFVPIVVKQEDEDNELDQPKPKFLLEPGEILESSLPISEPDRLDGYKRRVGRPKKVKDKTVDISNQKQTIKRKRGRPKKVNEVSDSTKQIKDDNNETIDAQGVNKRQRVEKKVIFRSKKIKDENDETVDAHDEGNNGETFSSYTCSLCGKFLQNKTRYRHHMISHTETRSYQCKLCPATYKYPQHLKTHMLAHNTVKPYYCEICGEGFIEMSRLKVHKVNKHTTDRPFKCAQCEAAFKMRSKLNRHMSLHSDIKGHQCEVCGQQFSRKYYLVQHMWTHTQQRRFSCNECERRFFTNYQLQCHLKVHSGERPYKCPSCRSAFIQRKELRKHMKKQHGQVLDSMNLTFDLNTDQGISTMPQTIDGNTTVPMVTCDQSRPVSLGYSIVDINQVSVDFVASVDVNLNTI